MADLIDRVALFADIDETVVYSGRISANAEMRGANKIVDRIKAAKAVDAVEVVRCEKCIGRTTWIRSADGVTNICGMSGMFPRGETDYCSYSERRTDADN